jgi:hypothetical protein
VLSGLQLSLDFWVDCSFGHFVSFHFRLLETRLILPEFQANQNQKADALFPSHRAGWQPVEG